MNRNETVVMFLGVILVWLISLISAAAVSLYALDYIAGTSFFGLTNVLILTAVFVVLSCTFNSGGTS